MTCEFDNFRTSAREWIGTSISDLGTSEWVILSRDPHLARALHVGHR